MLFNLLTNLPKITLAAAFTALLIAAPGAHSQTILKLPETSQHARISQRIGLTDISIDYHRPLVNGRKIFGEMLPYGVVWRTGANENTTIEFTDPVNVEGKPLPKGIYGLHMIPGESEWTVIFSKISSAWGSFTYDQAEDALRVAIKPHAAEFHEALTYDFNDIKPDSAVITLQWEKIAVPISIELGLSEIVQQNLKDQLRGWSRSNWQGWNEAADYLLTHKGNLQDALTDADHSIKLEDRFDNNITKAQILESMGQMNEAKTARNKAYGMGDVQQLHSYGRQLQQRGQQEQAFEIFRYNIKKNPENWLAHSEAARIASAQGDFEPAVKQMKLTVAGAPEQSKPGMEKLLKRAEDKEDINK